MKIVVGLGNPGSRYAQTRHNVGWRVVDALTNDWQESAKWQAAISRQGDVLYIKPLTMMNDSGTAVQAVLQYYKISLADMLVVFDDKDLPFGTIRFRTKGSSGGHNGMKSIMQAVGSTEFARCKIGIAPITPETVIHDTADYVLDKFTKEEEKALPGIITETKRKIETWLNENAH